MAQDKDEFSAGEHGLIDVKTVAGIQAEQARAAQEHLTPEAANTSDLATYVTTVFNENMNHKKSQGIEDGLLDNLRRRLGEYSPEKLKLIQRQGGSAIYAEITGVKCRNAESWLSDVFSPDDEKAWTLKPTPQPEFPQESLEEIQKVADQYASDQVSKSFGEGQNPTPEQIQELQDQAKGLIETHVKKKMEAMARKRTRAMETLMYDQLLQAKWDETLDAFLFDLTTLKAAIIKGPIVRMMKNRRWEIGADGKSELIIEITPQPTFERVSPFDFYPSPLADSADGPGAMIEKLWLTRTSLEEMKGMEGYDTEAIDRVLSNESLGLVPNPDTSRDSERLDLENKPDTSDVKVGRDTIFGLEFHGSVQGKMLIEYGLSVDNDGKQLRNNTEYAAEVIQVGTEVLFASLNPDKLERHPYSSTSWSKVAGSFWGEGVPELLHPVQDVCNASLRALVNNMGVSSGPQMSISDIDRIPDGEDVTDIYPFKIWQFTNERSITTDPVKFFSIPSNANELYTIYENFKRQADDDSGIPAYAYGNERTAGAGRTASGLSMLMTGASRGIKKVIRNVHRDVISPCLVRLYDWDMQFVDDPKIKGDAEIVAIGAVAVLTREQAATRRMELLNMTNNPTDLKLIGLHNRAQILREALDTLEFDGDRHVLTDDEIDEMLKSDAQAQSQIQQAEQQAAQSTIQLEQEKVGIDQQEADQDYDIDLKKLDIERQSLELEAIKNAAIEAAASEEKDDTSKNTSGSKKSTGKPKG